MQFTWVLNDIPLSNRRLKVTAEYKAKLMLKTGRISIAAHIGGDMDPPRGGGTCKPFDPKKKKK